MARLQWEPLAIPDISSSAVAAQAAAGRSAQEAIASLGGLVGQWEGTRRDANAAELFNRQNAFVGRDPAEYETALRSGALTQGLTYLRPEQLQAARSYAGELERDYRGDIAFADGREDRTYQLGERERVTNQRQAVDGATAALLPAWQAAQRTGNREAIIAATAEVQKLYPQLSAEQVVSLMNQGGNAVGDYQRDTNFGRGIVRDDYNFGRTRLENDRGDVDWNDRRNAASAIESIRGLGGSWVDVEGSTAWQEANPQQRIYMREAFGGDTTTPSATTGSFEGQTLNSQQAEVSAVFSRYQASPAVIAGFLGNFEVEGGYGGAQGDGGTASGIAQWRGPRRAEFVRRFGKDPHQASATEQAQFAVWELTTDEGRATAGISRTNADRIMNARDPGEAARLIDQYYERSDGTHRDRRVAAAQRFALPNAGTNQVNATTTQVNAAARTGTDGLAWTTRLPAAFVDDSSLIDVATRVTSTTPREGEQASPLSGQNRVLVQREIVNVQNEYRRETGKTLTPAAAAIVVERASSPYGGNDFFNLNRRGLSRRGFAGAFTGDQFVIDQELVRDALRQIVPDAQGNVSGLADTVTRVAGNAQDITDSTSALQIVETKRAELTRAEAADRTNRRFGNNPVTDRIRNELIAAQAQFDAVEGRGRGRQRAANQ